VIFGSLKHDPSVARTVADFIMKKVKNREESTYRRHASVQWTKPPLSHGEAAHSASKPAIWLAFRVRASVSMYLFTTVKSESTP